MFARIFPKSAALEPQSVLGRLGWLRGAIGAALGILAAGVVTHALLGQGSGALPWLVAPMGASAVLVFCVPASPLAQPWPLVGGNLISAAAGLAAGHLLAAPWIAAPAAVGIAIALMTLTRSLHPPGGACALLCALGSAGPESWGWSHMLPIAANALVLAAMGWTYNNSTGHRWPHVMPPHPEPALGPDLLYRREDIEAVLEE